MKARFGFVLAIFGFLQADQTAFAQSDSSRNLLGSKAQPNSRQSFQGHAALKRALDAALSGDIPASLKLAVEAFKDGGQSAALDHPETQAIAATLLQLSHAWESKQALPAEVATVLLDIVLPTKTPEIIRPYVGRWAVSYDVTLLSRSNSRVPVPESVGMELVRWSVLAKQTGELKRRLQVSLASDQTQGGVNNAKVKKTEVPAANVDAVIVRVIALQLAITSEDVASANQILQQLDADAKQASGQLLEYLCHAVSVAMREVKSEKGGLSLFETVLERIEQAMPSETGLRMNAPWLRLQAANIHMRAGRADDAKRLALSAVAKPLTGTRFAADYSLYLHHMLRQQAAGTLLDAGLVADGLNLASTPLSGSATRFSRGDNAVNVAARAGRELRKLAPAERFELLRAWALPDSDREELQSIVDFVPNNSQPQLGSGILLDIYSTSWELVSTARELGRLDELIRKLAAITSQTPSVQSLRTLAMVIRDGSANGSTTPANRTPSGKETMTRLHALLQATTAAVPPWDLKDKPEPSLATYVIAVEAALHPEWREIAEQLLRQLIDHSQKTQSARLRDHFRMAATELIRLRTTGGRATPLLLGEFAKLRADGATSALHRDWVNLRPKMWDSIDFETASERALGALSPTWFAYEGYLSHVSTGRASDLSFAVPLTGTFSLSAECREGGWTEGRIGYGGVASSIFAYGNAVYLYGKGQSGAESSPKMTNLLNNEPWNRYSIRVNGDLVQYFANGQLVFEDRPGTTAPWLTLCGTVGFTPAYRNLRISGEPTIPREVKLLGDQRMRGWVASYFNESKPDALRNRRFIQVQVERNGQTIQQIVEDDGTMEGVPIELNQGPTDWTFADGELKSDLRGDFMSRRSPSWLSYQRPLRDGETLKYEFAYQAGQTVAYPTFGEVVYAIGDEVEVAAFVSDQANALQLDDGSLTDSATNATTLKDGWNSAAISLRAGKLLIEVNGNEVLAKQILPVSSRRIGFYHDAARTNLRIRNVRLTGDWPKTFNDALRTTIESPESNDSLPNTQFILGLPPYAFTEALVSDNAYEISRRAVKLDTTQRYEFLHRWVMPSGAHAALRTSGAFTPTHPAPPVLRDNPIDVATAAAREAVDQRLVQAGGNFVCPAILLALAAAELDRLPELKKELTTLDPASSVEMARNRAALLGIIALLEDLPEEAIDRIRECQTLLLQDQNAPMYSRWGDVALASLAIQHPVTRDAAFELLDFIQRSQLQSGNSGTPEFSLFVRQLHGQCVYLMHGGIPEEFGTQPKTTQWRTVPQPRARTRGTGLPISAFDIVAGEMAQRGGHDFDGAYFQSPLRGNYEVRCRLSHFDFREAILMGAGIANALKWTHNEVKVFHVHNGIKELPIVEPISPQVHQWHDYKIVVKNGLYTSYVNGQKLCEEALAAEHDPWLAVVGWAGYSSRAVREIVISGNPVIPKELDLLGSPDLQGWMTDYYAADWGQSPFVWKLEEGELSSPLTLDQYDARGRLKIENIVRYHRPILEDGEVSYEFYYAPEVKLEGLAGNQLSYLGANQPKRTMRGQTLVHPALDRMVCLLERDGVIIHWLTDSRWDRTGLSAGNIETASAVNRKSRQSKSLPLKPNDWNTVKFMTKGDTLSLVLNGDVVFEREIEPTNLRHFGLFHYANESNVRVRKIRYRGEWPKNLPSIENQDLAAGPQKLAKIPDVDLPETLSWDFTKSKFNPNEFQYYWDSRVEKNITSTAAGLRFVQPAGETKLQIAGINPAVRIIGDFIATIDYEGLKTVTAEEQWGSGLSFKAHMDGSYDTGFEVRHSPKSTMKTTRSIISLYVPNRPNVFLSESISEFPTVGRLRLQRRGPVIYYFMAGPGSEEFRLLTQYPLGAHDIKRLVVQADASDKASGSEFLLKTLSIRAAKIEKVK